MRRYAVVFVHGLAKKPSPEKLEEIWRWGLERADTPAPFHGHNPGIDLDTQGVPGLFNYYADVFYGTDYETDLDAFYESRDGSVVDLGSLHQIAGELAIPTPANEKEARFLAEVERKMREAPFPPEPPCLVAHPAAQQPTQLEIASWLPGPVKEAIIKKAAMEAYYFLFNKDYARPADGVIFKVRDELRLRLIDDLR